MSPFSSFNKYNWKQAITNIDILPSVFAHNISAMPEINLIKYSSLNLLQIRALKLHSNSGRCIPICACLTYYEEINTHFYVHCNTLVNYQLFRTLRQKGLKLQNSWDVCNFTCNKLCLILNFLCSTAKNNT